MLGKWFTTGLNRLWTLDSIGWWWPMVEHVQKTLQFTLKSQYVLKILPWTNPVKHGDVCAVAFHLCHNFGDLVTFSWYVSKFRLAFPNLSRSWCPLLRFPLVTSSWPKRTLSTVPLWSSMCCGTLVRYPQFGRPVANDRSSFTRHHQFNHK